MGARERGTWMHVSMMYAVQPNCTSSQSKLCGKVMSTLVCKGVVVMVF